jgi:hypothetical protein
MTIIPQISSQKTKQRLAILAFTIPMFLSSAAWAKQDQPSAQGVRVVGQFSFQGKAAKNIVLHQAGDKTYLYVQFDGESGVAILDATQPGQFKFVSSLQSIDKNSASHLVVRKDIALVGRTDAEAAFAHPGNDKLTIWDISRPGTPRMVGEFATVKQVLEDSRGYIYVLAPESLWVVAEQPDKPAGMDDSLLAIFG